jgi:2-isopropylmalate synthase
VTLEIEHEGIGYRGVGVSTDTIEATILALLNAVNRVLAEKELRRQGRLNPQDA